MKKTLLTTLMAGTMALTLSALFSVPAMAACPVKAQTPCAKNVTNLHLLWNAKNR